MSGDQPGLFALEGPEPPARLSADARRTARQRAQIDTGWHPLTGTRTRPERGTCGDCAHRTPGRFPKCDQVPLTRGPGTDCRAWWPACDLHEPAPAG